MGKDSGLGAISPADRDVATVEGDDLTDPIGVLVHGRVVFRDLADDGGEVEVEVFLLYDFVGRDELLDVKVLLRIRADGEPVDEDLTVDAVALADDSSDLSALRELGLDVVVVLVDGLDKVLGPEVGVDDGAVIEQIGGADVVGDGVVLPLDLDEGGGADDGSKDDVVIRGGGLGGDGGASTRGGGLSTTSTATTGGLGRTSSSSTSRRLGRNGGDVVDVIVELRSDLSVLLVSLSSTTESSSLEVDSVSNLFFLFPS